MVAVDENNSSFKRISSAKDSTVSLEAFGGTSVLTSPWQGSVSQQWAVTDLVGNSLNNIRKLQD